jgi:hypothetical protein
MKRLCLGMLGVVCMVFLFVSGAVPADKPAEQPKACIDGTGPD